MKEKEIPGSISKIQFSEKKGGQNLVHATVTPVTVTFPRFLEKLLRFQTSFSEDTYFKVFGILY